MVDISYYQRCLNAMIKSGMSESAATDWFYRPNPSLNYLRPLDASWTAAGQKVITAQLSAMGITI